MCAVSTSTRQWPRHSTSQSECKTPSAPWPRVTSDQLHVVREPVRWRIHFGEPSDVSTVEEHLRAAARGPVDDRWQPPAWLLPHQVEAAQRITASLQAFGGALLADTAGLGKTYVSLAVATRYNRAAVVAPACLVSQWRRAASLLGIVTRVVSHEALSRGTRVPDDPLVIVDEAHRFRNPNTRRYDQLARSSAHLLLVTATPVVNRAADLVHLLRIFLSDHSLAPMGIRSLERALDTMEATDINRSAASVVVARSARSVRDMLPLFPQPVDGSVSREPPLPLADLQQVVRLIDELTFPSITDARAADLLRLHLWHRLASSVPACRETLRRHVTYCDRALAAAARGERLSRRAARLLFGPGDELQLELGIANPLAQDAVPDLADLESDRNRIIRLLETLPHRGHSNPKADTLTRLLAKRGRRRTIVFTGAVATALDLASRLRWRRIAVVGAGRAHIASGRVPVEVALDLFAPRARASASPPPTQLIWTLVATDLASEGLDLQDADAIVHFDLPWTPLRLTQRLGRIARLGATHSIARVWWFAPPRALEHRLRLTDRLNQKAARQLALGVSTTSVTGRASVWSEEIECRERIVHRVAGTGTAPVFAVVRGPLAAAVALEWRLSTNCVPELVMFHGSPPEPVSDYRTMHCVLDRLCSGTPYHALPPRALVGSIKSVLRERLAAAHAGPCGAEGRRLAKRVLSFAIRAGRRRNERRLRVLDAALNRLTAGIRVGAARELGDILEDTPEDDDLRRWVERHPPVERFTPDVHIVAALFGDGSDE